MRRRDLLSLCGLISGSQAERCSLWLASLVTSLVAAATHLRRLRYQLVAVATYLPKPRFSSEAALAGQACLQNRLNELGENFAIEIREW